MANLKDLIVNGATRVIGKVYAPEFVGKLTGNADTATSANSATNDSSGKKITDTYTTKTEFNTALGDVESLLSNI